MGQARRRGTFEERRAEAAARKEQEDLESRMREAELERNMTPGQRKRRAGAAMMMAAITGMMSASGRPISQAAT